MCTLSRFAEHVGPLKKGMNSSRRSGMLQHCGNAIADIFERGHRVCCVPNRTPCYRNRKRRRRLARMPICIEMPVQYLFRCIPRTARGLFANTRSSSSGIRKYAGAQIRPMSNSSRESLPTRQHSWIFQCGRRRMQVPAWEGIDETQ